MYVRVFTIRAGSTPLQAPEREMGLYQESGRIGFGRNSYMGLTSSLFKVVNEIARLDVLHQVVARISRQNSNSGWVICHKP